MHYLALFRSLQAVIRTMHTALLNTLLHTCIHRRDIIERTAAAVSACHSLRWRLAVRYKYIEPHFTSRSQVAVEVSLAHHQTHLPGIVEGKLSLSCRDAVPGDKEQPVRFAGFQQGARGCRSILVAGPTTPMTRAGASKRGADDGSLQGLQYRPVDDTSENRMLNTSHVKKKRKIYEVSSAVCASALTAATAV